ncbi:uroporphyrinogen-III synthase [Flavitalea flava]
MQKNKIRILSTRPLDDLITAGAAQAGIVLDILSFIETEPLHDSALTQRIRELSCQPLLAVFTSMNAVEAITRQLGLQASVKTSEMTSIPWKIFCIGHATQQLVRNYFGEDRIAGTADSARSLADTIITSLKDQTGKEIFFFCGDQRRDELPEKLRQESITVHELVVYKTIRTPQRLDSNYDGIVFFSPSAVHSFFSANAIPATTLLFAIGQTTAEAIRSYNTNQTIISASPEKEALIRQVIDHYTPRPPEGGAEKDK